MNTYPSLLHHTRYKCSTLRRALITLSLCTLSLLTALATPHKVKPKETLWAIASKYKISVTELKQRNNLKSDRIITGQTLNIPSKRNTKPLSKTKSSKPAPKTTPTTHTVRRGDTLSKLSSKYNITISNLLRINQLKNANSIIIGQKIKLTDHNKTTKTTTTATQRKIPRAIIVELPKKKPTYTATTTKTYQTKSKTTYTPKHSSYKRYKPTIILDPGHGGRDSGAAQYGLREKDLNMNVANRVAYKLRKLGYRVILTRTSDYYVFLSRRAAIANKYSNALFISIHFNHAHNRYAKGIETFYCSRKGYRLAALAQHNIKRRIGSTYNRGTKYRRFHVLKATKHPAILVECGFMSHYSESRNMRTAWWLDSCASGITEAVRYY